MLKLVNLRMRSVVGRHRILRRQKSLSGRAVPFSLSIFFEGEAIKFILSGVISLTRRLQVERRGFNDECVTFLVERT